MYLYMNSSSFQPTTICILGRQPALGLAELESLYGANHVRPFGNNAILDIEPANVDFQRLGGTIKVTKVLTNALGNSWPAIEKYLLANVPLHLTHLPEGKFTLGLSCYGLSAQTVDINKSALKVKKLIKSTGRPVRVVPNMAADLSSAQVLHNGLTKLGGWELCAVSDGKSTILAQTIFVQDINAYAARDQARPARDARVGMLPPKLAQIIINLAVGKIDESLVTSRQSSVSDQETIDKRLATTKAPLLLDPFCGTGVVLQEALLMGYEVTGTDLEPRMVEYSMKNLEWLGERFTLPASRFTLSQGDATSHSWTEPFDKVACETYLGRPLAHLPPAADLAQIVSDVNTIISKFLKNIASQAKPGTRMCLAVPAWNLANKKFKSLPVLDKLTDMGYNVIKFEHVRSEDLIYYREGQVVARQLIVLEKK